MRRSLLLIGVVATAAVVWTQIADAETRDEPSIPMVLALTTDDSEFDPCLDCHDDLDASIKAGAVQLIGFAHTKHFQDSGDVGCGNCHGLNIHDRTPPQVPTMEDCFSCHVDEGSAAELPCLRCHDALTVQPPQSHLTADWAALHNSAAALSQSVCETCHSQQAFCTACHGIDIPHPSGWEGDAHVLASFEAGFESCTNCHPRGMTLDVRDECDACHHPQNPGTPRWIDAHSDVVRAVGGTACFECHDPETCSTCHKSGVEDFSADLRRFTQAESADE